MKGETLRRIAPDNISVKGLRKIIKRLKNNGTAENLPRSREKLQYNRIV